jgi:truncated hemoglobin YjbI
VTAAGFKYLATEMVCWATGGPQTYTGRSMADSHRHLSIRPQEWEAFMDDFQQTLDKFKVPAAEQAELVPTQRGRTTHVLRFSRHPGDECREPLRLFSAS